MTIWPARTVTARDAADDLVRRRHDALGVGRVERDLADLDVGRLDQLARRDRLQGDDDRHALEPGLAGLLLGLVDQVERRATGDDGEDHADDDDERPRRLGSLYSISIEVASEWWVVPCPPG